MTPLYAFRFEKKSKAGQRDVLMVFVATSELDANALSTLIEDEIETSLAPDELLIVIREPSFIDAKNALEADSLNQATLQRLRGKCTVVLVGYDRKGREASRAHLAGPASLTKIAFADFKRRAIMNIFSTHRGFVESTPTYHFQNPSGRHTERFIRLSNILVRGAEISFIGFCTLPLIPDNATVAYLDTPSLYAVVAAINDQLASFDPKATILADNFRSYDGLVDYPFDRQSEALAIISASSSGGMASQLLNDHSFEKQRVIHLLFLGEDKAGVGIVCDLKRDEENPAGYQTFPRVELAASCSMCATGSMAIKLRGDQFDIAGPQPEALLISKDHAPRGLLELFDRLAGKNALMIGLGSATGRAPRQFTVNATALMESDHFQARLDYALRRSVPAGLSHIVHIDDDSAPLAQKIANCVGVPPNGAKVIKPENIGEIPIDTKTAIAIAGTVVESGRSLLDISRDLRSVAADAPLIYFIGFSKTTGRERREALERTLIQTDRPLRHQFVTVESMVLPPSSDSNAWTLELQLLQSPEFEQKIPAALKEFFENRRDRLRKASVPMVKELFIPNRPGLELKLQPGFVFWSVKASQGPHSDADVFFTISSILQQLRANAEHVGKAAAIRSNWFQQTLLAPENFGRFNDDIIQASLLRAAYPFELNYTNSPRESSELGRLVRRVVNAANVARGGSAAEFLLAIASRRLQLCPLDNAVVLSAEPDNSPIAKFLLDYCKSVVTTE